MNIARFWQDIPNGSGPTLTVYYSPSCRDESCSKHGTLAFLATHEDDCELREALYNEIFQLDRQLTTVRGDLVTKNDDIACLEEERVELSSLLADTEDVEAELSTQVEDLQSMLADKEVVLPDSQEVLTDVRAQSRLEAGKIAELEALLAKEEEKRANAETSLVEKERADSKRAGARPPRVLDSSEDDGATTQDPKPCLTMPSEQLVGEAAARNIVKVEISSSYRSATTSTSTLVSDTARRATPAIQASPRRSARESSGLESLRWGVKPSKRSRTPASPSGPESASKYQDISSEEEESEGEEPL
ncbi:hypothetical protein JCM11641_005744 [Rhodosporidiobolus odoratus]